MTTTFTSGEWHSHDGQIYPIETGKTLALIPYWDKEDEEKQANLKLIAAAPDMFETLSVVLNHIEQTNTDFEFNGVIIPKKDLIRYINIAIQKATDF